MEVKHTMQKREFLMIRFCDVALVLVLVSFFYMYAFLRIDGVITSTLAS